MGSDNAGPPADAGDAATDRRAEWAALVESAEDAILTASLDGVIRTWNAGAARMFGYTAAEIVGRPLITLIPPERHHERVANAERIRAGGSVRGFRTIRRRKDGTLFPISITISPIFGGTASVPTGASLIGRDLTDEARAADQLRALSNRLESAQEAERATIAREIHDDLGQSLTVLRLQLRSVVDLVPPNSPATPVLEEMRALLDATMQRARAISHALHPTVLDDLGLAAAIKLHARTLANVAGVRFALDLSDDVPLTPQRATIAYRIVQESLTNIFRHSGASTATIRLREEPGVAILTITDDGRGITPEESTRPGSLGLLGMRERAALVGGSVEVGTVPSGGTQVTLRMPTSTAEMRVP